jgi:hypothetical protein
MPRSLDFLLERLKQFDEITILELLDISTEDLLEKFKSRIRKKQDVLYGEVEIFDIDDPELDEPDEDGIPDGFQPIGRKDYDSFDDDDDIDGEY